MDTISDWDVCCARRVASMTSIVITAADAERVHGSLMGREEIVHYDKPIAAAFDAGAYVFREERKERQKEYRVSRRRHIGRRPSERTQGCRETSAESKSLQWAHTASSGFRVHFVEAESLVEEKMLRNRILWSTSRTTS